MARPFAWLFAAGAIFLAAADARAADPEQPPPPQWLADAARGVRNFDWAEFARRSNPVAFSLWARDQYNRARDEYAAYLTERNLREIGRVMNFVGPLPRGAEPEWVKHFARPAEPAPSAWITHLLPYVEQSNVYKLYQSPDAEPSDAQRAFENLESPRLGTRAEPLSPALAEQLALDRETGVLLIDVRDGTPAAKAGLKKYDVVLSFDGVKMTRDIRVFHDAIEKAPAKKGVEAVVIRRGEKTTVKDIVLPEPTPAGPVGVNVPLRDGSVRPVRSYIDLANIKDGTSNTILYGEWANSAWLGLPADAVTANYTDESVTLTVVGAPEKGKIAIKTIQVTVKGETKEYDDFDKAPEAYREKARALFALMEKRPAPAESKK